MTEFDPTRLEAYDRGEVELKDLIGLDEETMERLRGRAQFFLDGDHTERALIMLEMLEALDRRDPRPALLAADLLLSEGRSDAAEEKIEARLARDPHDAAARFARAALLAQTGRLVPAAALLESILGAGDPAGIDSRVRALAAEIHSRMAGNTPGFGLPWPPG